MTPIQHLTNHHSFRPLPDAIVLTYPRHIDLRNPYPLSDLSQCKMFSINYFTLNYYFPIHSQTIFLLWASPGSWATCCVWLQFDISKFSPPHKKQGEAFNRVSRNSFLTPHFRNTYWFLLSSPVLHIPTTNDILLHQLILISYI